MSNPPNWVSVAPVLTESQRLLIVCGNYKELFLLQLRILENAGLYQDKLDTWGKIVLNDMLNKEEITIEQYNILIQMLE